MRIIRMTKPKEEVYEVIEVSTKKPYRLYVDNEWKDDYETEVEALDVLSKWIDDNGFESFSEAYVSKIVKIKRVVKKNK